MEPTIPDLQTALPWTPTSYWRAGDYDAEALIAALKAQPELADYSDTHGPQSRVRLDRDADPGNFGFWVTIPADVDQALVDAAIAGGVASSADAALHAESASIESAWRTLRIIRDGWLSACQTIFDEIKNPGGHDLPDTFAAAVAANAAEWVAWRDAMRDLPAAPGVDPTLAVAAARTIDSTDQGWVEPWPAPPAAPVIYTRTGGVA